MSKKMTDEQKQAAQNNIKDIFEDGVAEINGREYKFGVMTFIERRKVFAYTSKIQSNIQDMDLSFLATDEFAKIEEIIFKRTTFEDMSLFKKNPFEVYMEDYFIFVTTALQVISYPFLKGSFGK